MAAMRLTQQSEEDRVVLARIDRLPDSELAVYDRWQPKSLKHYVSVQKPWLEDEIYFLGIRFRRTPTDTEIAETILAENHSQRFRAYYALRYPNEVTFV